MAKGEKARHTAALRFVGIHRKGFIVTPAWMRHVIDTATNRACVPCIENIEYQRRVDGNRRMQTRRGLPRTVPHPGDKLVRRACGVERELPPIARDDVACLSHSGHCYLQAFDRRIDKTHRPSGARLFA